MITKMLDAYASFKMSNSLEREHVYPNILTLTTSDNASVEADRNSRRRV